MANLSIRATARTVLGTKKLNVVRRDGGLPAVLYGHKVKNRTLVVPHGEFLKIYRKAGESTLVEVAIGTETPVPALIQDVHIDPVSREPLHVDFHQVNLREKITAKIKLHFTGVAPAVKEAGGVLMSNLSEVTVSCLPQDLVHEITVDIAGLKTFNDYIHVSDLKLPRGVHAILDPKTVVAHVIPPRSEEELKALEEKPAEAAVAEVAVAGKEEKPHAEGTDAAAAGEQAAGAAEKK